MTEEWRPGTVRYPDTREPGAWVVSSPGDALYSGAIFCATEYWRDGKWLPMWSEDDA